MDHLGNKFAHARNDTNPITKYMFTLSLPISGDSERARKIAHARLRAPALVRERGHA